MTRDAGPPPVSRIPRRELTATLAAIAVLTVVATVVGVRDWALPDRMFGGRQVTDVPPTLTALLAVSTLVCLVTATPVFHWLFTLVPAVLAGAVVAPRGAAATAAALSTGVVTMPLFALGWALLASIVPFPGDVLGTLWTTGILGAAPLALGVTIARKRGQTREGRAAAH